MPSSELSSGFVYGSLLQMNSLKSLLLGMHNDCGNNVRNVWAWLGQAASFSTATSRIAFHGWGLTAVFARFIQAFQQPFPTAFLAKLPLFLGNLPPLSTVPIKTTTKYI